MLRRAEGSVSRGIADLRGTMRRRSEAPSDELNAEPMGGFSARQSLALPGLSAIY
jgi:hypothetical protein